MKKTIAVCLAALLMITACAKKVEEQPTVTPTGMAAPPTATVAPMPQHGGQINLTMRVPKTLNPLNNADVTVDAVLRLLFEPLAVLDDSMKPAPNTMLVKSMELSADGMSVLVQLRGGVKWSDGTAITSADIAFSVETLRRAPEDAVYKDAVANILSVDAVDESTARINMIQPFGAVLYLLMFPIIPMHHYRGAQPPAGETPPPNETNAFAPLGNGLYVFDSYTAAEKLRLKASDAALQGRPYIDEISVQMSPDRASDLNAFEQKLADVVMPEIRDWARYRSEQATRVAEYMTMYFEFVGFNFDKELMTNPLVRQLALFAVDAEGFIEGLYHESAMRARVPVNPLSWLHNQTLAAVALDEAAMNAAAAGQAVTILVNEENAERVRVAERLEAVFTAAGAAVTLVSLPFDAYSARLAEGSFDIFVGGYNLAAVPDLSFMLHSQNIGTTNLLRYSDERMDELLVNAANAVSEQDFLRAMQTLQAYIAERLPCVGLVFRKSAVLMDTRVIAEPKPAADDVYRGMKSWFINEAQ